MAFGMPEVTPGMPEVDIRSQKVDARIGFWHARIGTMPFWHIDNPVFTLFPNSLMPVLTPMPLLACRKMTHVSFGMPYVNIGMPDSDTCRKVTLLHRFQTVYKRCCHFVTCHFWHNTVFKPFICLLSFVILHRGFVIP